MEDFIYIILGLVWLVISILGGLKKKQAPTAQSRPQPREESLPEPGPMPEIEDMLDDFFGTGKKSHQPKPADQEEVYNPQYDEEPLPQYEEVVYESLEEPADQDYPKYETKYAVDEGYQFSAQVMHGTLDNILEKYRLSDEQAEFEDSQMAVEDLDSPTTTATPAFEFDARKAIIYSEIINRKY
jgi:hypothetical protein